MPCNFGLEGAHDSRAGEILSVAEGSRKKGAFSHPGAGSQPSTSLGTCAGEESTALPSGATGRPEGAQGGGFPYPGQGGAAETLAG